MFPPRLALASLLVGGCSAIARSEPPRQVALALLQVRAGHARLALRLAEEGLAERPGDRDLLAIRGMASVRLGRFADALDDFEQAEGGRVYERDGLNLHADALRAVGRGRAAAELRLARPLAVPGETAALIAVLGAGEDLRRAGDLDALAELVARAASRWPDGAVTHALAAQLAMDLGDWEEAGAELWLCELHHCEDTAPVLRARARWLLAQGALEEAEAALAQARTRRRRSPELFALHLELIRSLEGPEEALARLERPKWNRHECPALLAEEAVLRWQVGQLDEARAALDLGLALYPDDPDLAWARSVLDGPSPTEAR